ncbi:hypothetical protein WKH57_01130 [Niallia taxi]|uniref:hypothetical protein n=1 Tax=Niallia taxi TaxID=2499688 RepID=UPI00317CAE22
MSETFHYKGVLKIVAKYEGENLSEQCQRLLGERDLPSYYDRYEDYFLDEYYQKFTIQKGNIYRIEKEAIDPYSDFFTANIVTGEDINFEVRYFNGTLDFNGAIEEAIRNMKKNNINKFMNGEGGNNI